MLIRLGYDIRFDVGQPVPIVAHALRASLPAPRPQGTRPRHRRRRGSKPASMSTASATSVPGFSRRRERCALTNSDDDPGLRAARPGELLARARCRSRSLPPETLRFLMASRFCEVDLLSPVAVELFGHAPRGWARVQAICNWVHAEGHLQLPARPPDAHRARRLHRTRSASAATSSTWPSRSAGA